jgi:lysophospholipase L1-like esterase
VIAAGPADPACVTTGYQRFVALGDSLTEGLGDGDDDAGHRGWADRLAEHLAADRPGGVGYANLAVRGRRAADVRDEQVPAALALRPDLATVVAGMNDLIRPSCRVDDVADCLDDVFARLTASGAQVATLTFPDLARLTPFARLVGPRLRRINERILAAGARFGVTVLDLRPVAVSADPRLWTADRLHASEAGSARLAAAFAVALGIPGAHDGWDHPLPPAPRRAPWTVAGAEARWLALCGLPWTLRRLRGRSSGDGRLPKRPDLAPVAVRERAA